MDSFGQFKYFMNELSKTNVCGTKNKCITIIDLVNSIYNSPLSKYEININDLESNFDDCLEFLYNRYILAKKMEWRFIYMTMETIIKLTKKIFSRLYNYYCDFNKHNKKYD